ncbi:hypothetical protein GGX14DRAFT_391714 [Mycena pura]|uniref:Uncharacterized protein n=1 Tax=Mycena pura TaxID=153505 RepID=A0AAD6VL00_9AGAR|nr:hypothetical protein GGX14DRAFT_391714 [Mycena pura]
MHLLSTIYVAFALFLAVQAAPVAHPRAVAAPEVLYLYVGEINHLITFDQGSLVERAVGDVFAELDLTVREPEADADVNSELELRPVVRASRERKKYFRIMLHRNACGTYDDTTSISESESSVETFGSISSKAPKGLWKWHFSGLARKENLKSRLRKRNTTDSNVFRHQIADFAPRARYERRETV